MSLNPSLPRDLDPRLRELVRVRVSHLNQSAYSLDVHSRAARAAGVDEARLAALPWWHGSVFFSDRERAALALTDAVTSAGAARAAGIADDVAAALEAGGGTFGQHELAQLLSAIQLTNEWNRFEMTLDGAAA